MPIQNFLWNDTGLGGITGQVGSLISVLDKVLVNGYNARTLTSLTSAGRVATATFTAHGYRNSQYVTIAGATGGDAGIYNGSFYIFNVTANTFDYQMNSVPSNVTAAGTPTSIVAPLGWTKDFTGTNLAVYRPAAGTRFYMRVDDTATVVKRILGYESMTSINTGMNMFPSAIQSTPYFGVALGISNSSDAVARPFIVRGDSRHVLMLTDVTATTTVPVGPGSGLWFGDFVSYKPGDAYNCLLMGGSTGSSEVFFGRMGTIGVPISSHFIARGATGLIGSAAAGKTSNLSYKPVAQQSASTAAWGSTSPLGSGPNTADGNYLASPILVYDDQGLRGYLQGCWDFHHSRGQFTHHTTFQGTGALAGKTLMPWYIYDASSLNSWACIELSDTFKSTP